MSGPAPGECARPTKRVGYGSAQPTRFIFASARAERCGRNSVCTLLCPAWPMSIRPIKDSGACFVGVRQTGVQRFEGLRTVPLQAVRQLCVSARAEQV